MSTKDDEVNFLTEDFDIPAAKAATLVAETEEEAQALAARHLAQKRQEDVLSEVPVPASPEEHEVSHNAGLQKPVLHRNDGS